MIELIDATTDETTHDTAIVSLEKYGIDFRAITDDLVKTGVETVENEQVAKLAMVQMRELRSHPTQAQTGMSDLEKLRSELSQVLPHEQAIRQFFEALVLNWLQAEFKPEQRHELLQILSQLGRGNRVLIEICIEQLLLESDTSARWLGAFLLGDVGTGTPTEIAVLDQFLQTESFKPIHRAAARSLAQLLAKHATAEQQLSEWLDRSPSEESELWLAYQLGVSAPRAKAKAIEHLVRLIVTSLAFADEFLYAERCYNFTNIVRQSARQLSQLLSADCAEFVVAGLSACLSDRIKQQEPERYRSAFELLWQCAYLLAPAKFFAAWSSGTGGK